MKNDKNLELLAIPVGLVIICVVIGVIIVTGTAGTG